MEYLWYILAALGTGTGLAGLSAAMWRGLRGMWYWAALRCF